MSRGHVRRGLAVLVAVGLVAAAVGIVAWLVGPPPSPPPSPGRQESHLQDGIGPESGFADIGQRGRSVPVGVEIPAIGVRSGVLGLGLRPDGTVEVPPPDSPDAGWYVHSPAPGELGPSVLLGHVDSAATGPGVFADLAELGPGDRIAVTREDGSRVEFAVERIGRYPKAAFPTAEVYGDLPHAGLRLITCGGAFDDTTGHYRDNIVVYAGAVDADPAG